MILDFISLNCRGILCAPSESLEDFQKRQDLLVSQIIARRLTEVSHVSEENRIHMSMTYSSLDLDLDWALIYHSHKKLPFWELAATWIFHLQGVVVPFVQIRSTNSSKLEEILKHEAVHMARSTFHEPIYEEFLAYATSRFRWRKIWGPLIRSSHESTLLMLLILVATCATCLWTSGFWMWILLCGFLTYLVCRLLRRGRIFKKMLKAVADIFAVDNPLKIAIRLSDQDINVFGVQSLENSKQYIKKQNTPRWEQILSSYSLR